MPNWCEGVLKVRGTKTNILRFFREGLAPSRSYTDHEPPIQVEENEWGGVLVRVENRVFWLKGTRRHFIDRDFFEVYFDEDEEEQVVVIDDFKAAWSISAEELAVISSEYQLDFKVYGFEAGMGFNQSIEIHKGKIVEDREITFNDYDWECMNPLLGG